MSPFDLYSTFNQTVAFYMLFSDKVLSKSNCCVFFHKGYAHCVDVYIKQCQEVSEKKFHVFVVQSFHQAHG